MVAHTPPDRVLSHWSILVEGLEASPLGFYESVEAALVKRKIPATENSRVQYKEAGLLSAKREYLHVKRETLVFDICGAPFGTGFFFSWWYAEDVPRIHPFFKAILALAMLWVVWWAFSAFGLVSGPLLVAVVTFFVMFAVSEAAEGGQFNEPLFRSLPFVGPLYVWLFKPGTYYRLDSIEMFQQAVHNAVLEVIDAMTTEKGLRALSESERKPIMRQFYDRKA